MASTPNFQASGVGVAVTNTTTAPAWPAHAVNDWALLLVQTANETTSLSDAQGFAEVILVDATGTPIVMGTGVAGAAGSNRLQMFVCRATSTSMAAPTIAAVTNHIIARIETFRLVVATGDPWWGNEYAADIGASDTAVSIPALANATAYANSLVVAIVANAFDSAASQASTPANADLASVTIRVDFNGSQGVGGGFTMITGTKNSIGTVGPTTCTLANASTQIRVTLVLKPLGADQAQIGWAQPMGSQGTRTLAPRVRGDLWVEPGDVRATSTDLDTWENI